MPRRWLLRQGMRLAVHAGYPVAQALAFLRKSEFWPADQLAEHQNRALQRLIDHCYENVPYYRDLMRDRHLKPHDFQEVADLAKLPHLTREIVREEGDRLRAQNYPDQACQFRRSGGTTGEPIRIATDMRARAYEVAAYLRGFEWMGYQLGQPMVKLFGGTLGFPQTTTLKSKLREWSFNGHFLSAFELNPKNVHNYVEVINQYPGTVLVGYTSAVRNLAEFVAERNLDVQGLQSIICTAEYMPKIWRREIGQSLNAPVFCYYGCGEANSIAYECEDEEGYLVCEEHIILEAASDDPGHIGWEGSGETCLTTLYNYAMPLIRYRNGDVIELRNPNRGRSHRRITDLAGRVVDQLLTVDGQRISGALVPHLVFKSGFPAWKYQVVQMDYDRIRFHYLLDNGTALPQRTLDELVAVFRKHLGKHLQVQFVPGDMQVSNSGKHRFVINRLLSPA